MDMATLDATKKTLLPPIEQVIDLWKRNGLKQNTTVAYAQWINRFLRDCNQQGVSPLSRLTAVKVSDFANRYARRQQISRLATQPIAHTSLCAWSIALTALDIPTVPWAEPNPPTPLLSPLLAEYSTFRHPHSNAADISITHEIKAIHAWLKFLQVRRRPLRAIRLTDVDAYLLTLRRRYAVGTVAGHLSSLRLFFRFLHRTGRLRQDLTGSIQSPPRRRVEPPRALPWAEVQKILRAVDRRTRIGLRDYAMLLLMSLYGLGSAEVVNLKLEDVHWQTGTLTIRRPKTGVEIQLPLLPAAGRALAAYLRQIRPPNAPPRSFFIRMGMPHVGFTSSAIRFAVRRYAHKAGVRAPILGGHILRHSHASRQVDQQAPPRVLSSILGHLDPESTSAYTRVAVERLRGIALPVPR